MFPGLGSEGKMTGPGHPDPTHMPFTPSPRGTPAQHLQWPQGDHEPTGHRAGRRPQLFTCLPALYPAGHARGPEPRHPPRCGRRLRRGQEESECGKADADPLGGAVGGPQVTGHLAATRLPGPLGKHGAPHPSALLPKVKPLLGAPLPGLWGHLPACLPPEGLWPREGTSELV